MQTPLEAALLPRVEWDNRPSFLKNEIFDIVIGILFVCNFFISIIISIWTMSSTDIGYTSTGSISFSPKLLTEVDACKASNPNLNGRVLALSLGPENSNVYSMLAKHPEIPAVMICIVPLISILWLVLMRSFTTTITWLSLLMSIAMWIALGAFLLPSEVGYILIAIGAIIFLFYVLQYKKIQESVKHLSVACVAIARNKDIIPVTVLIKAAYFGYLVLFALCMINIEFIWDVDPITCGLVQNRVVTPIKWYQIFSLLWISRYSDAMRLTITAMVVASWYFEQPTSEKSSYPALKSLKLVSLRSIGTLSISSVIGAIADMLIRQLRNSFWWLDPIGCILYLLASLLQQCLLTATTFTTIAHALTSRGFYNSGRIAYNTLRRNFVGAFVNDAVGETVVKVNAYYISVALFFASWKWFDVAQGLQTLNPVNPDILFFVIILGFIYLNRYPFTSLLIVNLLSAGFIHPVLPALFISSIAHIILSYFGSVILDTMNTLFFCHAISRDTQFSPASNDKAEVKAWLNDIPQGVVLSDPGHGGQISFAQPVKADNV